MENEQGARNLVDKMRKQKEKHPTQIHGEEFI